MPKSKRVKVVNLTKTDKKTKDHKVELVTKIREALDSHDHVYVFSVENMRNTFLKDVRNERSNDRFFFGRVRVMAKALGTTAEDEQKDNLHLLADKLVGNVGLLFSNDDLAKVKEYFDGFWKKDYARSGCTATETVTIAEGPVMRGEDGFPHNMEPQLRSLGMPTALVNGVVTLRSEHTICKEGDVLTPEQAQLLKHFFVQQADFHVQLIAHWTNGKFEEIEQPDADAMA
ncbi:ribosomal protein L10-domain-containing protein [Fimicolochytrium jonesii]|uniref:ribosomal protein L10-domain-containing protein n=1 Tax=Fimicolochytrium jonesii TaxID=1396493 RepID=UPI0022FF22FF|nr:ribosomal protein L10-domain-containing protein [Fimicolochytrium jonesii]KAI8824341.1 ribosomal protein L10-domain-containing protein [Fimicolochytrium jonesii]